MKRIQLMPMGLHDLADVAAIENQAFKNPWGILAFVNELAQEYAYNYVLKSVQGKIIGYFCFRLIAGDLHVLKVAVSETHRRKGIASAFFDQCLDQIPESIDNAFLEVRPANLAAIRLYEKAGFSVIGRRPAYYTDSGEDAMIMGKIFKGGSYERKNCN
ncbi:MAG: ribosomal protein S18-alanine N-acetyltransferase [Desulfobacterales bacterium]|nr:ribosomal protein S18-alanine N-acetyltransferase [Desulfobacterales bacterium]